MLEEIAIVLRSIYVSAVPSIGAAVVLTPLAFYLFLKSPRLAHVAASISSGLVGIPTVFLGLVLYLLLSRSGPLGHLHLLYTNEAIIIGHLLLVSPLFLLYLLASLAARGDSVRELLITLGLNAPRAFAILMREFFSDIVAAAAMCFSRALGELGIALMLGGDIRYKTRVLTTAIANETLLGNWDTALLYGIVLLLISITVSMSLYLAVPEARVMRA